MSINPTDVFCEPSVLTYAYVPLTKIKRSGTLTGEKNGSGHLPASLEYILYTFTRSWKGFLASVAEIRASLLREASRYLIFRQYGISGRHPSSASLLKMYRMMYS
jgi:hypothetical protein